MIVTGLDEAYRNLGKLTAKNIYSNAIQDTAEKILELAEPKVPHEEGILESSKTIIKQNGDVLVGYNSEYASYQHQGVRKDGTRIIVNRPAGGESFFLTQTVQQNQNQLVEFTKERIKKQLEKLL
jgi:hypothetical protein